MGIHSQHILEGVPTDLGCLYLLAKLPLVQSLVFFRGVAVESATTSSNALIAFSRSSSLFDESVFVALYCNTLPRWKRIAARLGWPCSVICIACAISIARCRLTHRRLLLGGIEVSFTAQKWTQRMDYIFGNTLPRLGITDIPAYY